MKLIEEQVGAVIDPYCPVCALRRSRILPDRTGSLLIFGVSFRPLEVANQFRDVVWMRTGILGVLVTEELRDTARQQFPDKHAGCKMRQGSLSLTPWWVHRLLHKGIESNSFLMRDFQIHSVQKSVFTR